MVHLRSRGAHADKVSLSIAKALNQLVGTNYNARKLQNVDVLVEVHTREQSAKIVQLAKIDNTNVTLTTHRSLNLSKGVISESELFHCSDAEIETELAEQGVVAARRILIRKNGEEIKTKHVVLTFSSTTPPDSVNAAYLRCRVRPYIPNLRRCFQCQRFGHGSGSCRGKPTCARCGGKAHENERCEKEPHCVNCSGNHGAYSRSCPVWKNEKEVMTIKTTQNLSYPEAKRRLSFQQKGTFAEVVRRGPAPSLVSVGTQVELRDLVSAVRPPPVPEAGLPQRPALTQSTQVDRVDRSADCSLPQPSTQVGPDAVVPATDGVKEASGLTRSSAGSAPAARSAPPSRGTVDTPQKKAPPGSGTAAGAAPARQRPGEPPDPRRVPKGHGKTGRPAGDSRKEGEEEMDVTSPIPP
ncbi:uncharacterized protein LOC144144794 [Haemaphysalis longicornis]